MDRHLATANEDHLLEGGAEQRPSHASVIRPDVSLTPGRADKGNSTRLEKVADNRLARRHWAMSGQGPTHRILPKRRARLGSTQVGHIVGVTTRSRRGRVCPGRLLAPLWS